MTTRTALTLTAALLAGLVLSACERDTEAPPATPPAPMPAGIELSETPDARQAQIQLDGCIARIEYRKLEPYILRYQNPCHLPIGQKTEWLGRLTEALFGPAGPPPQVVSLFVGSLTETFPEIAQRVALEIADEDEEDYYAARQKNRLNAYYMEFAGHPRRYPELADLFRRWSIEITGVSVEKVLEATPAESPFREALQEEKVSPGRLVPYDALTWFRLKRRAAPEED